MKYENFETIERIIRRIKQNEKSLSAIVNLPFTENSDGRGNSPHRLYNLCLCEHSDGSGFNADLAGSMIQMEVLKFVEQKLTEQIKLDREELKSL